VLEGEVLCSVALLELEGEVLWELEALLEGFTL
jgi:hypothetical protein